MVTSAFLETLIRSKIKVLEKVLVSTNIFFFFKLFFIKFTTLILLKSSMSNFFFNSF